MRRFVGQRMGARIVLEYYRLPIKLELVREVLPLLGLVLALGVAAGYAWAMKAFGG